MFPSWRIGQPFGINLLIHWTFWLLPLWVLLTTRHDPDAAPFGLQMGFIFALFVCVVLHELGHALTARRFGIPTERILLTPIGGIAQFTKAIHRPWHEFAIALAGPMVNMAIVIGLVVLVYVVELLLPSWSRTPAGSFVRVLVLLNGIMAVFNLVPAFPMDGGRVLRAGLSAFVGPLRATREAVAIGTVIAVVGGLAAVYFFHTPWPVAIAGFVIWAGQRELAGIEAEARQRAEEAQPVIMPLRSSVNWPSAVLPAAGFVWDAQRGLWVREDGSGRS